MGVSEEQQEEWYQDIYADLSRALPHCEIVEWICEGGMGVVAKAYQPLLDRYVAIKVLCCGGEGTESAERFQEEARTMAKLSHPNIVGLYDFGRTEGGRFFLVMEYVDGTSLAHLIKMTVFEPGHIFSLGPLICDALHYAHTQGVVHRDIKPGNILVTPEGEVRIADFGLAKVFATDTENGDGVTNSSEMLGTPEYMSPERLSGVAVDGREDVYALGVVFYEMLTGMTPAEKFQPASELVTSIDPRFDILIGAATDPDPERRTATTIGMKAQLETIQKGEAIPLPDFRAAIVGGEATLPSGDGNWTLDSDPTAKTRVVQHL